ncbi:MAG: histidine kinase [Balneolales bacterium]
MKFTLIFIVGMSLITGLTVDILLAGIMEGSRDISTWNTIMVAAVFTTVFTFSFISSNLLLHHCYIPNSLKNLWLRIGFASIVMIVAFLLTGWFLGVVIQGINILDWGSPVFYIVAGVSFLACIVGNTIYFGRDFYLKYLEAERERHESQMSALKSQINPHFMFNSLNSIASLVRIDPVKAERVIEDLSDLFRYSLQSSKKEEMTLKEELAATESYFAIEKARFGDRLEYTVDVKDELLSFPIPGLILQPLVENCVKHGAAKTEGPFQILLSAVRNGSTLHIEITDNGNGFGDDDLDEITSRGTGMGNIRDRLQLQYGGKARVSLNRRTVKLEIPIKGL